MNNNKYFIVENTQAKFNEISAYIIGSFEGQRKSIDGLWMAVKLPEGASVPAVLQSYQQRNHSEILIVMSGANWSKNNPY